MGPKRDAQRGESSSTPAHSPIRRSKRLISRKDSVEGEPTQESRGPSRRSRRLNSGKDPEFPNKRKKSDSKETLTQIMELLENAQDLNELHKLQLKNLLNGLVKVPPFSKLSWSEFHATFFDDTSKMNLPVQMPSSLKDFTQIVNGNQNTVLSPLYHLPSSTIGDLMSRAHDVVVALHPKVNEAAKVVIFDSIFIPIIRLFNGAITTLPESPVSQEERPFQPKGFADHKTFSLGGVSITFVELKRHLVDVEGLTQLLAEMLVARQDNARNSIDLDIYGILTDGVRYFFVVLDAKAMQFRVKADLEADFKNGRFNNNIIHVINMIFSILLTSVHDALGFTEKFSEMRSHVPKSSDLHPKNNSADYIKYHPQDISKVQKYKKSGEFSTRDSFKTWFEANQNLDKVKKVLQVIPAGQQLEEDGMKALSMLYQTFDLLHTEELIQGNAIQTQEKFIAGAVEQSHSFYQKLAMIESNVSSKDYESGGMKALEDTTHILPETTHQSSPAWDNGAPDFTMNKGDTHLGQTLLPLTSEQAHIPAGSDFEQGSSSNVTHRPPPPRYPSYQFSPAWDDRAPDFSMDDNGVYPGQTSPIPPMTTSQIPHVESNPAQPETEFEQGSSSGAGPLGLNFRRERSPYSFNFTKTVGSPRDPPERSPPVEIPRRVPFPILPSFSPLNRPPGRHRFPHGYNRWNLREGMEPEQRLLQDQEIARNNDRGLYVVMYDPSGDPVQQARRTQLAIQEALDRYTPPTVCPPEQDPSFSCSTSHLPHFVVGLNQQEHNDLVKLGTIESRNHGTFFIFEHNMVPDNHIGTYAGQVYTASDTALAQEDYIRQLRSNNDFVSFILDHRDAFPALISHEDVLKYTLDSIFVELLPMAGPYEHIYVNLYINSPTNNKAAYDTWLNLLLNIKFRSPVYGTGSAISTPFCCTRCRSTDHLIEHCQHPPPPTLGWTGAPSLP